VTMSFLRRTLLNVISKLMSDSQFWKAIAYVEIYVDEFHKHSDL
jgi:hypothetical protein